MRYLDTSRMVSRGSANGRGGSSLPARPTLGPGPSGETCDPKGLRTAPLGCERTDDVPGLLGRTTDGPDERSTDVQLDGVSGGLCPVDVETPFEVDPGELFAKRPFETVAVLEGDRQDGPVDRLVDRTQVDDVVPGKGNAGDEDVPNVLAVQSVVTIHDRLGGVVTAHGGRPEGNAVDDSTGPHDDPGESRSVVVASEGLGDAECSGAGLHRRWPVNSRRPRL